MSEPTQEKYDEMKKKALSIFKDNRRVISPAFWEIKITPEGFTHIEWKNKNHKRPPMEAYVRYLCFSHLVYILNQSKLYQEYRESMEDVSLKRHGKETKEKKIVQYYWFVAIVNSNKNRVKIVVRKVDGWKDYEFVSVIPAWKSNWYSGKSGWEMFFEEDLRFMETVKESSTTKKAIFKRK